MYCHLKSYSCTSSGTRILPESRNLRKFPSTSAVHCQHKNNSLNDLNLNDLLGTHINYVQAFLAHMRKQSTMGWDYFWGGIDTLINHWKTTKKCLTYLWWCFHSNPLFERKIKTQCYSRKLFTPLLCIHIFKTISVQNLLVYLHLDRSSLWCATTLGGFICTSPSWLSVTSSSSQCCWARMASQIIEFYLFRCHFAEPQKR